MNPSTAQPQPATLQANILYKMGRGINVGENRGRLEWGADDHIRLFQIDDHTDQVIASVFDIRPADIISIGGVKSTVSLTTGTIFIRFRLSGIGMWVNQFKQRGVKVTYWSIPKLIVLSLIIIGIFFAVLFPIIAIAGNA